MTAVASVVVVVALLLVKMVSADQELESQAAALSTSSRLLTPPPGNSLAITATTLDGKLKYVCEKDGGQWLLVQKRATLMDETNHTKVIGFYTKNYHLSFSSRHMGTWTIINSEGDEAESGHPTSLVSEQKSWGLSLSFIWSPHGEDYRLKPPTIQLLPLLQMVGKVISRLSFGYMQAKGLKVL